MKDDNIKTVEAYLQALKAHDLSRAPIADDIRFENPLSGKGKGAEQLRGFLSGFMLAIHDIRILQHLTEGEYIVTHWEVDSDFGIVSVLEKFHIINGKIDETISFFDPRAVVGNR